MGINLNNQVFRYEGQVNYVKNIREQSTGKLQITEDYLLFESYKATMNQETFQIKLDEIQKIEKQKTFYIIPNKLKIYLKNNKEYVITTWEQEKIYKTLNRIK